MRDGGIYFIGGLFDIHGGGGTRTEEANKETLTHSQTQNSTPTFIRRHRGGRDWDLGIDGVFIGGDGGHDPGVGV
jgi:hypothetical protein